MARKSKTTAEAPCYALILHPYKHGPEYMILTYGSSPDECCRKEGISPDLINDIDTKNDPSKIYQCLRCTDWMAAYLRYAERHKIKRSSIALDQNNTSIDHGMIDLGRYPVRYSSVRVSSDVMLWLQAYRRRTENMSDTITRLLGDAGVTTAENP